MEFLKKLFKLLNILIFNKLKFTIFIILNLFFSFFSLYSAVLYGNLLDLISNSNNSYELFIRKVLILILYILFLLFFAIILINLQGQFLSESVYTLRNNITYSLLNKNYSELKKEAIGSYISELTIDSPNIVNIILGTIIGLSSNLAIIIGSLIIIGLINFKILLIIIIFSLAIGILPLIIKKELDKSTLSISKSNQDYIKILKNIFSSIQVVKTFSAEEKCFHYIIDKNNKLLKNQKKNCLISSISSGWGILMKEIIGITVLSYAFYLVYNHQLSIGMILTLYALTNRFLGCTISSVGNIANLIGHKSVILKIIDNYIDVEKKGEMQHYDFKQFIELRNLSFGYNEKLLVLNNINIKFKKGGKYLILGKSGCGKSTLLKLIANFFNDYHGDIMIDKNSLKLLNSKESSSLVTYCSQEHYIFCKSIEENIVFSSEFDEEKLINVVDQCALNELISKNENGYKTIIDEEINQISGGEKSKINLARTLYKNTPILLIDEATSALDAKNSQIVESKLLELGNTIILVCHKFNSKNLNKYDEIIILDKGEIICHGPYNQIKNSSEFQNLQMTN